MSFTMQDLTDETHEVGINAWNWRPTIALLTTFNIFDDERLELMGYNGTDVEVTAEEAHKVATLLRERVLPHLRPSERVTYDLSVTAEPDDWTLYRDDPTKNYSANYEWLVRFAEFCQHCQGFRVL